MQNLTTRFWSKVEKTDSCWNWTGQVNSTYGVINIYGKHHQAHRIAYEWGGTIIPAGLDLDHICRNRLCVNPEHLRPATRKENNENHGGANKNSTSGVRGVNKHRDRWRAQVRHNGRLISAGSYRTVEEAEAAVLALRLELFTHNDADRNAA